MLVEVKKTTDRAIALGMAREVKQRNGRTARQLGELRTVAMQGRLGYFPTVQTVSPNKDEPRSQIRVLEPGDTYSETLARSPWEINIGSLPSTPKLREMQLQASLFQFIAPGVERS